MSEQKKSFNQLVIEAARGRRGDRIGRMMNNQQQKKEQENDRY